MTQLSITASARFQSFQLSSVLAEKVGQPNSYKHEVTTNKQGTKPTENGSGG